MKLSLDMAELLSQEPTQVALQAPPAEILVEAENEARVAQGKAQRDRDPRHLRLAHLAQENLVNVREGLSAWSTEEDEEVWAEAGTERGPCRCGGGVHDRFCLGCATLFCGSCAPQGGGGPCPRCGGPVWADEEKLSPRIRNPVMKGW